MSLTVGHDISAAETLATMIPDAKLTKDFNTVFSDLLKDHVAGKPLPVPVYVAGDDPEARGQVSAFVEALGMVAVDAGPLSNARYLEPMAEMMIQLGYGLGHGGKIGFALVNAA